MHARVAGKRTKRVAGKRTKRVTLKGAGVLMS